MNLQVKYVPEFTVIGKMGQGASADGPKWILPLWDQSNGRFEEISGQVLKNGEGAPKGMWGLMGNPKEFLGRWDEQGLYLAGCETDKDAPTPEGWTKWTLPSQTYLIADCTQTAYGEVFSKVISEYLPSHGLKMIGAAHERYPEPGNSEHVEMYFPIANGMLFCQSCGMPITGNEQLATEASGESNFDYCCYCYQKGSFTSDCTMEQMADFCAKMDVEAGRSRDVEESKKQMMEWFPTLKRWKAVQ